jgi:pyridoxine 5-phosphate synthase
MSSSFQLGLNIDHIATLRQARYRDGSTPHAEPDPVTAAHLCVEAGAHSITAHLREDRRHIHDGDILQLKKTLTVPLNLEMAVTDEMTRMALEIKPAEACLVPEKREEVTTEGGLNVVQNEKKISECVTKLQQVGVHVSLFIDPDLEQIHSAVRIGAKCIELHTGTYANTLSDESLQQLVDAARMAHDLGLQVNAGHGLHYNNLERFLATPHLHTLNIGHSIISRAIVVGLSQAVREMLDLMKNYGG